MDGMNQPLVSVIIPCYNAERWVAAAIESALGQTYPRTEVIVIDDGSTDRSPEIIKRFCRQITAVSTPNRGPSAARNTGFGIARGEWIQFLDADDLLHPEKLHLFMTAYKAHPSAEFIWAPYDTVDEKFTLDDIRPQFNSHESGRHPTSDASQEALLAHHAPWAAAFRKGFLERVGSWNESLKGWEDLEYHARIAAQLPLHARLTQPLHFYREHGGERVHLPERNPENIRKEIECLMSARVVLESSTVPPRKWKDFLWGVHLDIANSWAAVGDVNSFVEFMLEAAHLRGRSKFRLKCYAAVISARTLGLRRTTAAIERMLGLPHGRGRRWETK